MTSYAAPLSFWIGILTILFFIAGIAGYVIHKYLRENDDALDSNTR